MLKKILSEIKFRGINNIILSIRQFVFPKKAACFSICEEFLSNKIGLEIGGLSDVFKKTGILPVYSIIKQLDNCNFSGVTTWEGNIEEGLNFYFNEDSSPGQQYIAETTNLSIIESAKYDFILSSHMLEHTANPLKALSEWTRVLKDDGFLLILLPHKDGTFDHQRPVTTLEHIIEDFESGTQEDDLTHLPEILEFHDLSRDPEAGTRELFKERSEKNFENRCLHQHIFDTSLAVQLIHYHYLQIHAVESILPCHIVIFAQKVSSETILNNDVFLDDAAIYKCLSPFSSDRLSSTSM
jgi:SAM-dependent methyltransferase